MTDLGPEVRHAYEQLVLAWRQSEPSPSGVFAWGYAPFEAGWRECLRYLDQLDLATQVDRLREACATTEHEVQQILGRALGYPRYADDQTNFPGATAADGVNVGEHVAATLAQEAADLIAQLRAFSGG